MDMFLIGTNHNMLKYIELNLEVWVEDSEMLMVFISGMVSGKIVSGAKKKDKEPQLIQCCGCGSWVLLNILGEPTAEPAKIYGLQDELDFGKHKGKTVKEVVHSDFAWIKWAIVNSDHFLCDVEEIIEEHQKDIKALQPDDILAFGKYKGLSLKEAFDKDEKYVLWLSHNVPDVEIDFSKLITVNPNI